MRSPNSLGLRINILDREIVEGFVKTIGIVGCGAIGRALVAAAESGSLPVRIAGITSRTSSMRLSFSLGSKALHRTCRCPS